MREKIFERFRQVDSGPARRHGGTGLGLSIAREFVSLHGGSIEVVEAVRGGARFVVKLPLSAPEGVAIKTSGELPEGEAAYEVADLLAPVPTQLNEAEVLPPGAPLILVVEDNPDMNTFITGVLRRGHRVASAYDGAEGLEQALRLHPDLIVTDLMMPRMSGDEMIGKIRRRSEFDDVPILLLTAMADEQLRVELLASGVQDSLTKPFLAEELAARAAGLIARKRKAEESLRESEERFRATFENAAVGMAQVGPDGRWLRVNKRLADFLGYSHEELTSMTWREVTYPEDIEGEAREYDRLMHGETERFAIEKRYLRNDGGLTWGRLTASLLRSAEGTPLYAISIIEDINDRKAAYDALRVAIDEAEKRAAELDRAFEILPVGIFLADAGGRVYKANQAFKETWSVSRLPSGIEEYQEYKGWWPGTGRRLEPHEWPMAQSAIERVFKDEEIEIEAFDGKRKVIRAISAPIVDAGGKHIGGVAVNWDITAYVRTQEELRKARDYLEERVRERTAELTKALEELRLETEERVKAVEELRKNEQMLIQQSRMAAMGEMLRNISHQWRQPLNVLAAKVQQLGLTFEYGGFSEELLEGNVHDVMQIVKRMSRTIDELQHLVAPGSEKGTFSVVDAITRTVSLIGEIFQNQGIRIEMQSSEDATVRGDRNDYGQVLMNLLTNARDALLEARDVDRSVIVVSRVENGTSVVTVTDNAGGIAEQIQDKIFDPYFTTKELGKGSGVGLFLSKMIVEKQMGGSLSCRNVEGGAEFEIRVLLAGEVV